MHYPSLSAFKTISLPGYYCIVYQWSTNEWVLKAENNSSQALVKMYVAIISHSYFTTVFTCPLTTSRDSNLQPHLASPRSRQIDAWILSDQELSPLSRLFASMPFCFVFPGSAAAVAAVTERERERRVWRESSTERGPCKRLSSFKAHSHTAPSFPAKFKTRVRTNNVVISSLHPTFLFFFSFCPGKWPEPEWAS